MCLSRMRRPTDGHCPWRRPSPSPCFWLWRWQRPPYLPSPSPRPSRDRSPAQRRPSGKGSSPFQWPRNTLPLPRPSPPFTPPPLPVSAATPCHPQVAVGFKCNGRCGRPLQCAARGALLHASLCALPPPSAGRVRVFWRARGTGTHSARAVSHSCKGVPSL